MFCQAYHFMLQNTPRHSYRHDCILKLCRDYLVVLGDTDDTHDISQYQISLTHSLLRLTS